MESDIISIDADVFAENVDHWVCSICDTDGDRPGGVRSGGERMCVELTHKPERVKFE